MCSPSWATYLAACGDLTPEGGRQLLAAGVGELGLEGLTEQGGQLFEPLVLMGMASLCLMSCCILLNAILWTGRSPRCSGSERLLWLATLVLGQIVVIVAGLGLVGVLGVPTMLGTTLALTAVHLVTLGQHRIWKGIAQTVERWRWETARVRLLLSESGTWPGYLAIVVVLLVLATRALSRPPMVYDDLYYHLGYPADWLKTGRLDNPYHPWGGPFAPYYGLSFELLYFWLLAPLQSDVLAKVAQLPALVLLCVAVYAVARGVGARRQVAVLAALIPWSNPTLVTQGFFNVNSDLWAACMLLVSMALTRVLYRQGSVSVIPASVAVGLFLGSRSYSSVFAPVPFALLVAAIVGRWLAMRQEGVPRLWGKLALDLGLALGIVFVSGGFWYARNLLLIGNPLQPSIGSVVLELSDDAVGEGVSYSLVGFLFSIRDQGVVMPVALLGFLIVGFAVALRERRHDMGLFGVRLAVLAAPLALFGLFYLIPPWVRYERFLMIAVVAAYPSVALVLSKCGERWISPALLLAGSVLLAVYPLYISVNHVAAGLGTPSTLGLSALFILASVGVIALCLLPPMVPRPRLRVVLGGTTAMIVLFSITSLAVATRDYRYEAWESYVDGSIGDGWRWIEGASAERGTVIAYTGSNLPYPLYGSRYQNPVLAVPLDGDTSATHYGFGRRFNSAPVVPDQARWMRSLADLGVEYLFVSSFLTEAVEFPLEDAWARDNPNRFSLVHANERTRIYSVASTW